MDWPPVLTVLTPVLLLLLTGMGWLYRHERERRELVERQLSEPKYKAYMALINVFFDAMKATKGEKPLGELTDRMIDANKDVVIYGSDDVVKTYLSWQAKTRARSGGMELELFELFGEVVIAIRRDMGNPKTKIVSRDILRMIITDFDEALARGKLQSRDANRTLGK